MTASFVICGAPRTKGNHAVVARNARRVVVLPSKQYRAWYKSAMVQAPFVLQDCRLAFGVVPILAPVTVTAVFYRDRACGDEDNFKKGLGDYLQRAGVIKNDKQIHWSGDTRLDKDAAAPRIEVQIETVAP